MPFGTHCNVRGERPWLSKKPSSLEHGFLSLVIGSTGSMDGIIIEGMAGPTAKSRVDSKVVRNIIEHYTRTRVPEML